jgi:hypothetical protein
LFVLFEARCRFLRGGENRGTTPLMQDASKMA